jgi:two-component system response regulator FlrC
MTAAASSQAVLVVEDDAPLREALVDTLAFAGYEALAAEGADQALAVLRQTPVALMISDIHMPGADGHQLLRAARRLQPELPVVLLTAFGSVNDAVAAMRDGAADYLQKPFESQSLLALAKRLVPVPPGGDDDPVAEDPQSRRLLQLAARVAASDATVLITGDSGTGKEVLARYVHRNSRRCGGPFVAINCAAIPESMLEAVLFGHERGAFTGAHLSRPGKFELAQGGTMLLDEVSEMELALQAKLLRVLQEREVERIGGSESIRLDVRVIATSNRQLREEVAAGRFREDLFYRLNVVPLVIAPLRERPGDILPLIDRALHRWGAAGAVPELDDGARAALLAHDWPGNVRELENLVQRALVLTGGRRLEAADLDFENAPPPRPGNSQAAAAPALAADLGEELRDRERRLIIEAIRATGTRERAATRLGISARTLRHKLQQMRAAGVEIPASR